MKWMKPVAACLFMLVICLCFDPSSIIPLKGLQNSVRWLTKFLQGHFNITLILLCMSFLVYIIKDVMIYFDNVQEDENSVHETQQMQTDAVNTVGTEIKATNTQIARTQSRIIDCKTKFDKESLKHIYNIKSTLSSMNQIYDNNLKTYHATNRRLYHIVSSTTLYSKGEIQPLIEQYQKLHE